MARRELTLGEKIALAATGNHEEEFPEDIEYETSAKVVDTLDEEEQREVRPVKSSLRTKNVQLLDELDTRYAGTKVSRKKLTKDHSLQIESPTKRSTKNDVESAGSDSDFGSDDEELSDKEDVESKNNDDEDSESYKDKQETTLSDDGDEEEGGEEQSDEEDSEGNEDEDEDDSDEQSEENETLGLQTLGVKDKEVEMQKGRATLNQLRIWDSLLEVRIRLQKNLIECNRLPRTEAFDNLIGEAEATTSLSDSLNKSQEAMKILLHELLRLQKIMIQSNSETKKAIANKGIDSQEANDPMNEEITSEESSNDEDDEVTTRKRKFNLKEVVATAKKMRPEEFLSSAEDSYQAFVPYRNQVIQKWNDKTQFAGGKFNKKSTHHISTLKQIEQIFSNKERLLKRTQIRRGNYSVIGDPQFEASTENQESIDPEIFDDDDFYHQLLRELIDRKTSNVNDPIQLSHHWLELQKMRTKLKRKVDTKASKGRKIRYDVHAKLVNFMAPHDTCNMSNAAVKELFGSLFGNTK